MVAVDAVAGAAAAARVPLVAGFVQVLEVGAAGALEQVAAGGGGVAQLRGGAREECLGQGRPAFPHPRVGGQVAVADVAPTLRGAVGQLLDGVQRQPADVDQRGGPLHAEFEQVDQVGAAGEVAGAGVGGVRLDGFLNAAGPEVSEAVHSITSSIASTMRG